MKYRHKVQLPKVPYIPADSHVNVRAFEDRQRARMKAMTQTRGDRVVAVVDTVQLLRVVK